MSEASATPHGEPNTAQSAPAQQLNRSCESCRSLKVRCLPSPSTPNQCQRCAKGKKACIFVAPQRRRPRKRTDSRVAQLEKEMRMMRSLLKDRIREESEPESPEVHPTRRGSWTIRLNLSTPRILGCLAAVLLSAPPSFSGLHMNFTSDDNNPPVEDVIDQGIISLEDAEQLVVFFIHELASFFPLVVLPSNTTAAHLRQTKPILFLSVIAAASISIDAGLASVLNREMVRLYAERFFIEGEKSLELVQALLIMIIFYYPPTSPLKLQFYQYTHIASTMALEIGLATKCRVSKKKSDRKNRHEVHDEHLVEQARAVLGCYHLGSTVAMKTRRPNLLQFNDWMAECVDQLERSPHRTDQHLAVWFELQRITDEAMSSFGLDDTSASSPLTESRVQAVLRWFDKRMDAWKKSTPTDMLTGAYNSVALPEFHGRERKLTLSCLSTVPMILEYRSAVLAMYELGVGEGYRDPDAIKKRYFTLPTIDEDSGPRVLDPQMSAIRIDINVKWMNAAQELLDAVLTCSIETMRRMPNLTYTRFSMAMTSLLKIHFSVRTGALGEVVTPETVNVGYYLDAIANKLGEAAGGGKYKIPSRWYHVVGVKGRDWYERLERRYTGSTGAGNLGSGVVSESSSTGTESNLPSGPMSGAPEASAHLEVNAPAVDSFSVPPGVAHLHPGIESMRDGYVAMSGAGMWQMDGGHSHGHGHGQFFQPMPSGYQPSHPQSTALPHQFAYDPQRMPSQSGAPMPGTGMELDGWLPDGSIFGMPPLPEF
ncbi:Transcription factor [Penicillium macrosclerotiorum]|uniref:Transcription factor n=1 Tax=Penicillium macrosclerotiorum TaxID=303699 RepID=UPI002548F8AA|nr:Transcription factor [Penicillium macrosclerotiorum]KAJ5678834.1 Transcription factor [Penicillium macrosclerotiorum]